MTVWSIVNIWTIFYTVTIGIHSNLSQSKLTTAFVPCGEANCNLFTATFQA